MKSIAKSPTTATTTTNPLFPEGEERGGAIILTKHFQLSTFLTAPGGDKLKGRSLKLEVEEELDNFSFSFSYPYPTTNGGGMQKWKLSWNCIHIAYTFGTDLNAQSVLINKTSASELSRKLIKSALLVGLGRLTGVQNCYWHEGGGRGETPTSAGGSCSKSNMIFSPLKSLKEKKARK